MKIIYKENNNCELRLVESEGQGVVQEVENESDNQSLLTMQMQNLSDK